MWISLIDRRKAAYRAPALLLAVVAGAACQSNEVATTTRNLQRPGPLALACATRDEGSGAPVGAPLEDCTPDSDGATRGTLFGLVANTARGDVALFNSTTREELIDLDPGPGFGFVAVGALPTALATTSDGCRAVTANSGSCDLSLIEIPGLLEVACTAASGAGPLDDVCPTTSTPNRALVSHVTPRTSEGPLLARPQDILIVPAPVAAASGPRCSAEAAYRAYVTFPACGLVAEIDLQTGLLRQGLLVTPDGFSSTETPRCPIECHGRAHLRSDAGVDPPSDAATSDAAATDAPPADGAVDGGGTADDSGSTDSAPRGDATSADADAGVGIGPVSDAGDSADATPAAAAAAASALPFRLALRQDGDRLFVSSAGAPFVSAIDLADDGQFRGARKISLSGGGAQTTAIAVSPNHPVMGDFVYAVAADRTVRAISVALEQECETNLDLALLLDELGQSSLTPQQAGCFPVANNPPRNVTAEGAGLDFGALVPVDITFFTHAHQPDADEELTARMLDGVFGLVALSDGSAALIDLADNDVLEQNGGRVPVLNLPHRLRGDSPTETALVDYGTVSISGQRTSGVPVVVSEFAGAKVLDQGQPLDVQTDDGQDSTSTSNQETGGVILRALGESAPDQRLVFEQQLMSRFSGQLRLIAAPQPTGLYTLRLEDRGGDFCAAGVLGRVENAGRYLRHGDIVRLVGCVDDDDCGIGQVCRKPLVRQSDTGLCLDEDGGDSLFARCQQWLRTERDYLAQRVTPTTMQLETLGDHPQRLLKAEPETACETNADCPDRFYCVVSLGPVAGSRRWTKGPEPADAEESAEDVEVGVCARPGCRTDADCPNDGLCVRPLDGSPAVCSMVPPPIDPWPLERTSDRSAHPEVRSCDDNADCAPSAGSEGVTCEDDGDCPDPATECRRTPDSDDEDEARICQSKSWQCARFGGRKRSYCVRASPCFNQLQRYTVNVGRALRVSGAFSPRGAVDAAGECTSAPDADPLQQNRIPIGPAVYPFVPEPRCESAPPVGARTTPTPNPCFQLTDSSEDYSGPVSKRAGVEGKQLAPSEAGPAVIVRYANPKLSLSLGISHLSRVADLGADAVARRSGPPLPERGLSIDIRARSTYRSQVVRESSASERQASDVIALPSRLIAGPDGHVYLSDTGDRGGSLGSRGQVRRIALDAIAIDESFVVR